MEREGEAQPQAQTSDPLQDALMQQILVGQAIGTANKNIYCNQFIGILISFVVGLLFYLFSTTPGYYGDENSCIQLRKYSYIMGVFTLVVAILLLIIVLYGWGTNNLGCMIASEGPINAVSGIVQLVLWILLWVALAKGEDCGDLATLVWIFTWLIILSFVFVCCFLCCAVGVSAGNR